MSDKEKVYDRIQQAGNLPTLPEVLLQLLAACEDDETTVSDIADIIRQDPSLSAKVLQLVNSAYYSFRYSFTTIDQAVVYLGANTIKNLAVTMSIHQVLGGKRQKRSSTLNQAIFWWQSLMCGSVAKRLAAGNPTILAEEAYLTGLLHNIGLLTLASTFPEKIHLVIDTSNTHAQRLELEEEIFGINHCEAGSWLIRQWNLNPLIADAVLYHHAPFAQIKEAFPLVQTLYAATSLTRNYIDYDPSCEEARALFGLSQSELDDIAEEAREEVDSVATSMGIKVRRGSLEQQEDSDEDKPPQDPHHEQVNKAVEAITERVKNTSLQTGFLEELLAADGIREMLCAFESCVNVVYHIDAAIFFLPDDKGVLLEGHTSSQNSLAETSKGLRLPLSGSSSKIVRAFSEKKMTGVIKKTELGDNIADRQMLSLLQTEIALPLPLFVKDNPVGVAVLAVPEFLYPLPESDRQLLGSFAQQLALCLFLEQEKMAQRRVLHQERMEAISTTARKFAHEINNPLGIINNYLTGIKIKFSGEMEGLEGDLEIISEEIHRISAMVSQMRQFAQAPFAKLEQLDLNRIITDLVTLTKTTLFASPELRISFVAGSDLPIIVSSKDAIKQILINLLKNAAEAMPDGGRVSVRTRKLVTTSTASCSGVEIIVADTGPGLPEIVQQNLYQPFISTKQSSNSGLGLSIVYKAVLDIGGELSCTTDESEGTTFVISLPLDAGRTVS